MSARNLDALFRPSAIALVGASNRPGSVGAVLARNLFESGFKGPVMPVNPHETSIRSVASYRSIAELPVVPDLAVIATPPATVPGLVAELGARGCRAAVVVTAGFGEAGGEEGAGLRRRMLEAARPHLMRIVGPNGLGFISPGRGVNASFAQLTPPPGDIAFLTQSGAVATTMLDWAAGCGLGFSHLVSLGDMSDVDFGDLLDHLALDPATRSILLYVETVTAARKFMSAARVAARAKPVIVVKAGRGEAGARAALSHTGALAGSDAVYDAAFRRAGMLRVAELRELFDAAATLGSGIQLDGERLVVLTNGGGLGVMAADALEEEGGRLEPLSDALLARLDPLLPAAWSRNNPVDVLGDADGPRYAAAFKAVAESGEADAVLALNCPTGLSDGLAAAEAMLDAHAACAKPPLLAAWMGGLTGAAARRRLRAGHVPTYETPEEAVRAFQHLVDHRRNRRLLMQTPPAAEALPEGAVEAGARIVRAVLADGRSVLTEPEAKGLLAAFGIPVVETRTVATPAEAAAAAAELAVPVALKILSRDVTHKSDVGGVRLDLEAPGVEQAAREMLEAVAARAPTARIDGFTVQPMVRRPGAQELLLGVADDPTFGPVLMVGQGGTAVEVLRDRAMALPPLNTALAREAIARTRVSRLLAGYRDVPPADVGAVAAVLVRLSELIVHVPEVVELDINPLLADAAGVVALDARVVVRAGAGADRLAIRPYPAEMSREVTLPDGAGFLLRAVRPEDGPALERTMARCTPDDLRAGFLGRLNLDCPAAAARLSQIDYDREMTLIAVDGESAIAGFVRMAGDPDFETADFVVLVRSDLQGRGLGRALLGAGLDYARARGVRRVTGDVFVSNGGMVDLGRRLGATVLATDAAEIVTLSFDLAA
ncbi:MAG TPA: bifunctional acetate--CoA ligase family protein/GNAT family N-acetyltransferase [Caulobacteraceae bacterium]|jgi:acetyltransferase|nr:bifunctional acetate--CoA ligase family protein/GNAT family N-acetyltransferase [Caulobacteraceae bacterium]